MSIYQILKRKLETERYALKTAIDTNADSKIFNAAYARYEQAYKAYETFVKRSLSA